MEKSYTFSGRIPTNLDAVEDENTEYVEVTATLMPLTIRQLQDFDAELGLVQMRDVTDPFDKARMAALCKLCAIASRRSENPVTAKQLHFMIGMGNMVDVVKALMGVSGFVDAAPGAAAVPTSP